MNKMLLITVAALLAVGCAKKQKALTMQETVVEPPSAVQHTATVNEKPGEDPAGRPTHVPIYFSYNSSELVDESRFALARLASALKGDESLTLTIEGHCDERGTTEYNLALGERRARAAREYLVKMGVPSSRIDLVSYGEERPAETGEGERAWALNRRDEFILSQN